MTFITFKQYCNTFKRFIDNKVLNLLYRPHKYKHCALYSITTIYNYLFNVLIDPDTIQNIVSWDSNKIIKGKIGNDAIIKAFIKLTKNIVIPKILFSYNDIINNNCYNKFWNIIKYYIYNKSSSLIYHEKGHYTIICGFIEEPLISEKNIETNKYDFSIINKWLIISEHRIRDYNDINNGLLRQIKWNDIIQFLTNDKNTCIILFHRDK